MCLRFGALEGVMLMHFPVTPDLPTAAHVDDSAGDDKLGLTAESTRTPLVVEL